MVQKPESSMLGLGPVGKHAAVREGVRLGGKVTPTRPIGRDRSSLYLHVDKWERVDPVYMELSPYTHFTTETSGSSRPPTPPPGCTPDHVPEESGSPEGTREEGFVHETNLTGDDGPSLFSNKLRYQGVLLPSEHIDQMDAQNSVYSHFCFPGDFAFLNP